MVRCSPRHGRSVLAYYFRHGFSFTVASVEARCLLVAKAVATSAALSAAIKKEENAVMDAKTES
jgi:hypothetical protein